MGNDHADVVQVQGYRIQPYPILQLPKLTQVSRMHARAVLWWGVMVAARRLQTTLVQICRDWMIELDRAVLYVH